MRSLSALDWYFNSIAVTEPCTIESTLQKNETQRLKSFTTLVTRATDIVLTATLGVLSRSFFKSLECSSAMLIIFIICPLFFAFVFVLQPVLFSGWLKMIASDAPDKINEMLTPLRERVQFLYEDCTVHPRFVFLHLSVDPALSSVNNTELFLSFQITFIFFKYLVKEMI